MRSYKKLEPPIQKALGKLLRLSQKPRNSVAVFLVDNATMRRLNRKYRGKNKTTNVLAFPTPVHFRLPPRAGKTLGEIYLAPNYIKKKSEDSLLLLIHGFLHLVGFDHQGKSDTIIMEKLENKLFHKIQNSKIKM